MGLIHGVNGSHAGDHTGRGRDIGKGILGEGVWVSRGKGSGGRAKSVGRGKGKGGF